MPRITKNETIRRKQEDLALKMQSKALEDGALIDTILDVFDRVTKWMAVSNKLEDQGESDIDRFKRRINGEGEADIDKRPSRKSEPNPGKQPRLVALRARLPHGGNGGADGDSGDPGDEAASTS